MVSEITHVQDRRRVLLVEDEMLVAMLAADNLAELGYDVAEASTARAAMECVTSGGVGLAFAVVDLGLPDKPGEALIAEMRSCQPDLPIIVASGYGEEFLRRRIAVKKDIAFLGKPYDLAGLKVAIAALSRR
jgi:DNA-binding response OmpR family regulator